MRERVSERKGAFNGRWDIRTSKGLTPTLLALRGGWCHNGCPIYREKRYATLVRPLSERISEKASMSVRMPLNEANFL